MDSSKRTAKPAATPAIAPPRTPAQAALERILLLLHSRTGHDFSLYKQSAVGRRLERCMSRHDIGDAETYARYLDDHPEEVQVLFRALLISVTRFFRDALAFEALKADVLPPLLADRPAGLPVRVWVAGCATGEEAYSIAIVLRELLDDQPRDVKLQIQGTDLDDEAIAAARAGRYAPTIAQDVSPERLQRFFDRDDTGYRVKPQIRDMVDFTVQSVIKDPPFTRLDLLSCRNLMIYFEAELQDRLMPVFHDALRPGGVLLMSPSESVGNHRDLFEPINRRWKLYRAKADAEPGAKPGAEPANRSAN